MYTTQLQAGQGLVDETRALLGLWRPGMSTQELYQSALSSGRFPKITARRLRNIVVECFAPRYLADSSTPAGSLKAVQDKLSPAELQLLFLLFTCRANEILGDFLRDVYWPRYEGGYSEISKEDAERFVGHGLDRGKMVKRWSDSTIGRVSAYLLGACGDYGLLSDASRGRRKMQAVHVTPLVISFVAHELHFRGVSDSALPASDEWAWFGLEPAEVLAGLKQVAMRGWLIVQTAADHTQISWSFKSMEDFCDAVAHG
ncbi:MAG: BrxA family protein [Thermoanaerobaculia bacterium]